MNIATIEADYAVLSDTDTVRLQRTLPGPVERVWQYLTDSDLRRQWLAAGDMDPGVDTPFELVWRNDALTDPPGDRPDDFGGEHRMQGRIIECDPPRRLAFTWSGDSDVTITLEPRGDDVLLTLVHRRLGDHNRVLMHSAGWHAHLDLLVDRVHGRRPEPFWNSWLALKADYDARLPH
ncbi:MAG: SRPBCC family protein [Luteimonas sp.]|nr:SRPBCC family protein [Luteimonas sp.]